MYLVLNTMTGRLKNSCVPGELSLPTLMAHGYGVSILNSDVQNTQTNKSYGLTYSYHTDKVLLSLGM